jgi:uncharacterized protein (TIGR02145 family)
MNKSLLLFAALSVSQVFSQPAIAIVSAPPVSAPQTVVDPANPPRLASAGSFVDTRDSREYRWVRIGSQKWMAENLVYGPKLPDAEDLGKPVAPPKKAAKKGKKAKKEVIKAPVFNSPWCYQNDPENCLLMGRLYDLKTAQSSCPVGWKLPSNQDWKILEKTIGLDTIFLNETAMRGAVGAKLKAKTNWLGSSAGTDEFGMSIIPSGLRTAEGQYLDAESNANFWADADAANATQAYFRTFSNGAGIGRYQAETSNGLSVRCIEVN